MENCTQIKGYLFYTLSECRYTESKDDRVQESCHYVNITGAIRPSSSYLAIAFQATHFGD